MRFNSGILLVLLTWLAAVSAHAAHTQATLLVGETTSRPGTTVLVGVRLVMDEGWHTYWQNSGQSGLPTSIDWNLPPGVKAGEIQWPVPIKVPEEELTTYVYEKETVLLVPLTISAEVKPGALTLKARLDWLECETKCIKEKADVSATLTIGGETKTSPDAAILAAWKEKIPASSASLNPVAWWDGAGTKNERTFILEWTTPNTPKFADFYPDQNDNFEVQPATQILPAAGGKFRLGIKVKKSSPAWPAAVSGVLVQDSGGARKGYNVRCPVLSGPPAISAGTSASPTNPTTPSRAAEPAPLTGKILLGKLVLAFVGGFILNIMPCVLPVIALKILGFVREAQNEPARVRKLGLIYTAGVLSSFLALALIIIGLQAAGKGVGWGFQFTNPYFLVAMITLIMLVTLNLFGVFEITLDSTTLTAANNLATREGAAGTFFNGLLATVLATSCSAPIFAPAVGFAFSVKQPLIMILIFLTAGLGLASPYLVLSFQPKWLKFLPKPGLWMNRFKVAMGFPMLAACVWLYSLITAHYGDATWWLAIFLVFVAVAAWVFGEFVQRASRHRAIGLVIALLFLFGGYAFALEHRLDWRHPTVDSASNDSDDAPKGRHVSPKGLPWKKYSPAAVAEAQAAGHPVVVDFTATWCPNCNIIIKPTLENSAVQAKLKEINAVLFVSDYSTSSESLASDLAPFNRAAIPIVLVYSAHSPDPQVFDIISPGSFVEALEKAAH